MAPPLPEPQFFTPEGRLSQVEYAIEGVTRAGACVGIVATDGIVLAAEVVNRDPLLDLTLQTGPIYRVDQNNACVVAGVEADGYKLVDAMKKISKRYSGAYGQLMPMERLVERICEKKQAHTMYTGLRPFGISVLYMGWDSRRGFQLYDSDPSGVFSAWSSNCIGRNALRAQTHINDQLCGRLKPGLSSAVQLAIEALGVAMDGGPLNGNTVQLATLEHIGQSRFHMFDPAEVEHQCRRHNDRWVSE